MKKEENSVQPNTSNKIVSYKPQDFVEEYKVLCEKMGYQIVVNPAFAATNHGSFEIILQTSVGKMPKQNKISATS